MDFLSFESNGQNGKRKVLDVGCVETKNPDEALQQYFESFDWYIPTIQPEDFEESFLNEFVIANRDLIVEFEIEQGYR